METWGRDDCESEHPNKGEMTEQKQKYRMPSSNQTLEASGVRCNGSFKVDSFTKGLGT